MQKSPLAAAAACVLSFAVVSAAHADMKVVQNTTIKNPQLSAMVKSMSPQQRAMIAQSGAGQYLSGAPMTSVYYSHGPETRVDIGSTTSLVNTAIHKITTINRTEHTYSVAPFYPKAQAGSQATVHATGQTKVILGHKTREYAVKVTLPNEGKMTGDVWSAPDLPQPSSAVFSSGPAAALAGEFAKIKGLPLLVTMQVSGTPIGATSTRSITTSISRAKLPSSVFSVPHGYRKVADAAHPAGMGNALP